LWACVIQWPTGRGFTMKYGPGQKTTLEFTWPNYPKHLYNSLFIWEQNWLQSILRGLVCCMIHAAKSINQSPLVSTHGQLSSQAVCVSRLDFRSLAYEGSNLKMCYVLIRTKSQDLFTTVKTVMYASVFIHISSCITQN
jgi:hypothetical protein